MGRKIRELSGDFPIHIGGRSNNREFFPLPLEEIWEILSDHLFLVHKEFEFQVISLVLMSNHFHLLGTDPEMKLSKGMGWFMRETSREIGRRSGRINKIWGGPFHSSIIRSPLYYFHAYKYVYRNPIKAGLCKSVLDYPFSTLNTLVGSRKGILPTYPDETLFNDIEGTLRWLDEGYSQTEEESIGRALKKKEFKLRQDPKSRNPLSIESWESVPISLRNYRK